MKPTLDSVVNILLGVTCVVITSVGVMDLRARLSGAATPATSTQSAAAKPQQGPAPKRSPVEDVSGLTFPTSQGIIKARGTPKVALIEFSDFECPFCGAFERGAYQQIQRDYVDSGKVEYVFVDFPRETIHPHAMDAAEAFRCAAQQGRPWEMHDKLFQNQKALAQGDLIASARDLGLNVDRFNQCFRGTTASRLRDELALGDRAGIIGTPSFLIGQIQPNGDVRATRRITGAAPFNLYKDELDAALAPAIAAR